MGVPLACLFIRIFNTNYIFSYLTPNLILGQHKNLTIQIN
jgi:hypothetical protein